ncbi:SRPBCC family protein [Porticoccaceae bacterium LTM1]|nr:SRPBCC family protein [Porticoccaceae bacterium LTM1]
MMFFKKLLLIVAALLVAGIFLPSSSHVERSVEINADKVTIFNYLNRLKNFNEWSPWVQRDLFANYEFSGPEQGVGSTMRWSSEKDDVGSGIMRIVSSEAFSHIELALNFDGQGSGSSSFFLSDKDNMTEVVWSFDADHGWNIVERYFGLMLDGFIGKDYEEGLSHLKQVIESKPVPPAEVEQEPQVDDTDEEEESAVNQG